MVTYEELLAAYDETLVIREENLLMPGLYCDGCVYIDRKLTDAEKVCILAEEIGHHFTSTGDILDQRVTENQIQERRAREWAYKNLLPLEEILQAAAAGYTQVHEMAEHLNVDEKFLRECLAYYGILDVEL